MYLFKTPQHYADLGVHLDAFQTEYSRAMELLAIEGVWRATCYKGGEPTEYRKYRVVAVRVAVDEPQAGYPIPFVELDLVPLTTGSIPLTVQTTSSLFTSIDLS